MMDETRDLNRWVADVIGRFEKQRGRYIYRREESLMLNIVIYESVDGNIEVVLGRSGLCTCTLDLEGVTKFLKLSKSIDGIWNYKKCGAWKQRMSQVHSLEGFGQIDLDKVNFSYLKFSGIKRA